MDVPSSGHDPVLLGEILELLAPSAGGVFVDCTIGRGGHAQAITSRMSPDSLFIGLDADPRNLEFARDRLAGAPCRVRLFHANFAELEDVLREAGNPPIDAILADLGISTNQLFDQQYGLSFSQDMPLDMRLDPRLDVTAADLVNKMREDDLANVLYELAQERYSRRIARKIVDARRTSPINSTERLAELIRSAIPTRGGAPERIDPATRTFMALRMKVNHELENLERLLTQAPKYLSRGENAGDDGKPDREVRDRDIRDQRRGDESVARKIGGGRIGIISFHSMEDRLVKQAFRSAEQTGQLKIVTKKPITPSPTEESANPRSRSAKLRVGEKV